MTRLAVGDVRAQPLASAASSCRRPSSRRTRRSPRRRGCAGRRSLPVVDFDLAALLAMTAGDEQIRPGDQRAAFRDRRGNLLGIHMDDPRTAALRARDDAHHQQRCRYQPDCHSASRDVGDPRDAQYTSGTIGSIHSSTPRMRTRSTGRRKARWRGGAGVVRDDGRRCRPADDDVLAIGHADARPPRHRPPCR